MKNDFGSVFCDETLHSFTISEHLKRGRPSESLVAVFGKLELEIENTVSL